MIDLHCHLIWGVDDGCQTREESLAMARALVDQGVHTVACTPHLRHDRDWVNIRPDVAPHVNAVRDALGEADIPLTVHPGAEHYLTLEFFEHLARGEHTPYGTSNAILLEIPYSGPPPDLTGVLYRVRRMRLLPVLAHVERYARVGVDIPLLRTLHEHGHVLQVNLGSIIGAYGPQYQEQVLKVLEAGLAHVVAGDCHGPDDPAQLIRPGLRELERLVGMTNARRLSEENPAALLAGQPVEDME